LNETKREYEWHPNLEIKSLEDGLRQQEFSIGLVQKDITAAHRQASECLHKIQLYHLHFGQPPAEPDSERSRKGRPHPSLLFEQIRRDLQLEQRSKEPEREERGGKSSEPSREEGGERSYKVSKRVSVLELLLAVALLVGAVLWCHWAYCK
jgi:hypothetical protein